MIEKRGEKERGERKKKKKMESQKNLSVGAKAEVRSPP